METNDLMNSLTDEKSNLDDVLKHLEDITFTSYINQLLIEKGLERSDVIEASGMSRDYLNQLFNNTRANPGKKKVLCISIAMGLDLDETNRLLKLTDNGALYPKLQFDATIIYCITRHMSVMETNSILFEHGYDILK